MHTQEGRRASQRALGAAQSCLRGYRDTSKGEFAPASHTRATWAERVSHGTRGSCGPHAAPSTPVSGCLQELAGRAGPRTQQPACWPSRLAGLRETLATRGHCHPESLTGVTRWGSDPGVPPTAHPLRRLAVLSPASASSAVT